MNYNLDTKYEQDRLEAGKYELFIKDLFLNEFSIVLNLFESREYQHKVGETVQGVEIKLDRRYEETGNLFIEVAHKKADSDVWYDSGVCKTDNTWLYVMGDYKYVHIFSKRQLKRLYESKNVVVKEVKTNINTSRGYLLTKELIEKYNIYKIEL